MNETFLSEKIELHCGDCLVVLPTLAENLVDACVTDPPYHLTSIVKRFKDAKESDDTITSKRVRERSDGYARLVAGGFMGKQWDGGDIAFRPDVWREVWRVLKPGGHLLSFGGTRTYHRMACAIEDAGFEIRDTIM
jgi:DNA modification methylase